MKPRLVLALLSLALPALRADSPPARFVDPATSPEAREILATGEAAINRLANVLVSEMRNALLKGTADDAVDLCHLKKLPMTGDRITGLPRIRDFKLTSLRVRAPANAPDAADQAALAEIVTALERGDPPAKLLLQRVEPAGAPLQWRVYRPLGILPQCVTCHGDPAEQSPALQAKLRALYPKDEASGYSQGEWRGLIRVTVDAAPPPAAKPTGKR